MDKTCANCATAETREDESLFCPTQEEPTGPDDTCSDWQSKLKVAKTCLECGYIKPESGNETGWKCELTGYECAKSQPACNDYTEPVESEIDESESLSGKDIEEETPQSIGTVDFNLYRIPGFSEAMSYGRAKIYEYLSDSPSETPEINIKLKFPEGVCKPDIKVSLPNTIKISLQATTVIRENGTLRLELPEQPDMFFDSEQTGLDYEDGADDA